MEAYSAYPKAAYNRISNQNSSKRQNGAGLKRTSPQPLTKNSLKKDIPRTKVLGISFLDNKDQLY